MCVYFVCLYLHTFTYVGTCVIVYAHLYMYRYMCVYILMEEPQGSLNFLHFEHGPGFFTRTKDLLIKLV